MIVAITGANGFIGQHLVRRFTDAGWQVRTIVRRDFESDDVREIVRGARVIVHAAGATRSPSVASLRAANVTLTERMLAVARDAGVSRFIFISSQAAAGPATATLPITEDMAAAPLEPYGQSKRDAETIVSSSAGIETVIVRPASVYGPGDRDFLTMFQVAQRGAAIHPANREHWLSIIHVRDVAEAVMTCAESSAAVGQTYFLANDEPVQWAELFRLGAESAGRTLRWDVNLPESIVQIGAMIGDVAAAATGHSSLLTTRKVALSRPVYWVCSNGKARRDLSFLPQVELRHGLAETYAWYKANKWL